MQVPVVPTLDKNSTIHRINNYPGDTLDKYYELHNCVIFIHFESIRLSSFWTTRARLFKQEFFLLQPNRTAVPLAQQILQLIRPFGQA